MLIRILHKTVAKFNENSMCVHQWKCSTDYSFSFMKNYESSAGRMLSCTCRIKNPFGKQLVNFQHTSW